MHIYIYTHIHTVPLHYIALHCLTLHYITYNILIYGNYIYIYMTPYIYSYAIMYIYIYIIHKHTYVEIRDKLTLSWSSKNHPPGRAGRVKRCSRRTAELSVGLCLGRGEKSQLVSLRRFLLTFAALSCTLYNLTVSTSLYCVYLYNLDRLDNTKDSELCIYIVILCYIS